MRKKILIITPYLPYPPVHGGIVRLYNLIKHLSKKNEVYLLSFIAKEEERRYIPVLKNFCQMVSLVLRNQSNEIGIDYLPRSISAFYTPEMIENLQKVVKRVNPDIIQIDFLNMAQYVNHIRNIPTILTEHDMSSIDFGQSFYDRDLPEKLRFVEWSKIVNFEKEILPKFHSVVVLTKKDQRILKKFLFTCKSIVIPTGVDIGYFQSVENKDGMKNLLYIGHYGHYPNLDAIYYFLERIFPYIVRKVPKVKFYIVGSGADENIVKFKGPNIIITGEVKDVREYFARATVFVAPIRLGGGIKGKVLEAMSSGIPVVATEEVRQGINCESGKELIIAMDDIDFAEKTIDLLNRREYRIKIAKNARRFVEKYYDWKKIINRLDYFYDKILNKRG